MEKYSSFKKEIKKYKKIAICSHDAGGAEVLSSLIKKENRKFYFVLSGPAIKIFKKKLKNIKIISISDAINKSEILITSTSIQSDSEKKLIKTFKEKKKITISILDGWSRYKERFIYKDDIIYPDFIWCSDIDSYNIAKKIFLKKKIKIIKNYYFADMIKDKKIGLIKDEIIFVSNNHDDFYNTKGKDIFIFRKLLKYISSNKLKIKKIGFKLHPSEKNKKYKDLIKKDNRIYVEKNASLSSILSKYRIVAGHQSMALVIGNLLGLKTINIKLSKNEKIYIPKRFLDVNI